MRRFVLLPLLASLWALPGVAQPFLVKDINPSFDEQSSSPNRFTHFGRYAIFAANTLTEGVELRSSDGTAAGTFLLADACPGACSSDPAPVATTPRGVFFTTTSGDVSSKGGLWITRGTPGTTVMLAEDLQAPGGRAAVWMESQGVLYFSGSDNAHGAELWRSDGTPAGTYLVKDVWPGPAGLVGELEIYRGRVFFGTSDGATGWALWSSDGTPAGTGLVKDPSPNPITNEPGIRLLRATTGYLFFDTNGTAGRELWRSDGTTAGTRLVADLTPGPGSTNIANIVPVGNHVLVEADAGFSGQEVWVSDGTARGTRPISHFNASQPFGYAFSLDRSLSAANMIGNRLIFPANETGLGRELWTTDGTVAGTHLLADVCPGVCSAIATVWPAFQNRIYFTAVDAQHGLELWVTDGTAAGTHLVRDLCPGTCSSAPADPMPAGNALLFTAKDAGGHRQVWKTDGTAAGTVRLSSFPVDNFLQQIEGIVTPPGRLFFAADDGVHGEELWLTNGTVAGTRLVANLDGVDHGGSMPDDFMAAGGILYFFANDGVHGSELWKSDGTAGGTELVHEFSPGPGALARFRTIHARADLGGLLLFSAQLGFASSVWRTDGTDAGTYALTPPEVQVDEFPEDLRFRAVDGKVFFLASSAASGKELWVTDGTLAGTHGLDLLPGTFGSDPYLLTPFGNEAVFIARSAASLGRNSLWKSDGTDAGTAPFTDAVQPTGALTVHQGFIYFLGSDGRFTQLWRSDGTAAGTVKLPDLVPGRSFEAQSLTSLGSRFLFWDADTGLAPRGLWASDDTGAGAKQISSVTLLFSLLGNRELGGVVYFGGSDGHADLLWRTDGTEAGTYPLRDHNGQTIAKPDIMTVFDGKLYFITPDLGATLWQSDGTAQGTFPLRQLEPGQRSSLALGVAGSRLFFRAFDPATGSELWAINGQ